MNATYQTYYQSPVGLLKIGATDHIINQVLFVNENEEITPVRELSTLLQQCIEQLIEYFNGARQVFDLPVYQEGTPFQNRVWSELLNIKFGRTISYLDLAKRLGDPKVIRAAASSNGKNNICIIVPCHRVVGTNNSLVGYSGGLPRKKWLLNHENKIVNGVQTLF